MDIAKLFLFFMDPVFGRLVQGELYPLFYSKPVSLVVFPAQFSQAAAIPGGARPSSGALSVHETAPGCSTPVTL